MKNKESNKEGADLYREAEWEQRIRHLRKSLSTLETKMDESVHEEMEGYRENLRYMVKETKENGRNCFTVLWLARRRCNR